MNMDIEKKSLWYTIYINSEEDRWLSYRKVCCDTQPDNFITHYLLVLSLTLLHIGMIQEVTFLAF